MAWSTAQEAVRDAIALALQLEDFIGSDGVNYVRLVEWENRSTASRGLDYSRPWADLMLGAVMADGSQDETRYTEDGSGDPEDIRMLPTYCGPRLFTVDVRIGVDSQEPGEESVGYMGSRLRTRLRRDDARDLLTAGEVALVSVGATINADYMDIDGRMVSCSITSLRFRTVDRDLDSDSDGDWIATTEGEGEISRADDTTIDVVLEVP